MESNFKKGDIVVWNNYIGDDGKSKDRPHIVVEVFPCGTVALGYGTTKIARYSKNAKHNFFCGSTDFLSGKPKEGVFDCANMKALSAQDASLKLVISQNQLTKSAKEKALVCIGYAVKSILL